MSGEMGEGPGVKATVDGHLLASGAIQSSDLSEIRVQVREVAEALGYPVKWDSQHRAVLIGIGTYPVSGAQTMDNHDMGHMQMEKPMHPGMIQLVLNGKLLADSAEPMMMGGTINAVADELAAVLGVRYQYDAAYHVVKFVSKR